MPSENISKTEPRSSSRKKKKFPWRTIVIATLFAIVAAFFLSRYQTSRSAEIKRYTFVVRDVSLEVADGTSVWMWGYNSQVPGPTIRAQVGDTIEITLVNMTDRAHSVHSHGLDFANKDDGSIASSPEGSIVPPGGSYKYTFVAKRPGFFYYHCHSEDDQPVSVHMQQGLYGAVIVDDPAKPLPKADVEEVVFFGEVYGEPELSMAHACAYCTFADKYFTIDARTYPLTTKYHPIKAKVGDRVRFYVVNIGNDIHSWHLHRQPQFLIERTGDDSVIEKRVESQVVSLVPGVSATIDAIMEEPGTWLFHCHVVPHADKGMDSVITVER